MVCNPKNVFSGHNKTTVFCNVAINIPAMFAKIFSGLNTPNANLYKALLTSVNVFKQVFYYLAEAAFSITLEYYPH